MKKNIEIDDNKNSNSVLIESPLDARLTPQEIEQLLVQIKEQEKLKKNKNK